MISRYILDPKERRAFIVPYAECFPPTVGLTSKRDARYLVVSFTPGVAYTR
jgi:hypothetical protein